jgi:selT/selW/selH-like putative selenoprotein
MQMKDFLQQQGYSERDVVIQGGNWPAPAWKQTAASLASYAWLGGLALNFAGEQIFNSLGMKDRPAFYTYLKSNPMGTLGGLFLLNNMCNSMLSSGAFEIHLDGVEIFSKLKQNRVPTGEELMALMQEHGLTQTR